MSFTNFAALSSEQYTLWARTLWKQARNESFINKFLGKSANAMVHHVDELKKDEKGARAIVTLLADLVGDGIAGDRTLEGNEESLQIFDQNIRIDQLRHASRHEGRMADQKSVFNFRENAKNNLAYWLADRMDQMAFLTLSGVSYGMTNTGAVRTGSGLTALEFANDVSAPSANRRLRWDATAKVLVPNAATNAVAATDVPMWDTLMAAKTYAKSRYIRGVRDGGGEEVYHAFLSPQAMLKLKQDDKYVQNLRHAAVRDSSNPLFTGTSVKVDGIFIHEFRHVYNTAGAASGAKWGATGTVDGCQLLFCGAQALALADIGDPYWVEKGFDYDNQQSISVGKMFGFLKPQFPSIYEGKSKEDFAVLSIYTAQ